MPNENTWKVVSTDIISAWNSFHINCDWWTWLTWAILNNWGILTNDRNQVQDNWIIFWCLQWCASLSWIKLHEYCDCIGWCDWCDIELLFINTILYFEERRNLYTCLQTWSWTKPVVVQSTSHSSHSFIWTGKCK